MGPSQFFHTLFLVTFSRKEPGEKEEPISGPFLLLLPKIPLTGFCEAISGKSSLIDDRPGHRAYSFSLDGTPIGWVADSAASGILRSVHQRARIADSAFLEKEGGATVPRRPVIFACR